MSSNLFRTAIWHLKSNQFIPFSTDRAEKRGKLANEKKNNTI